MTRAQEALCDVVLCVIGLAAVAFFGQWAYVALYFSVLPQGRAVQVVEFRNQSDAMVVEAAAPICGRELRVFSLPPGASVAMRFPLDCSEQSYGLSARLTSGKELGHPDIYVSGLSGHDIMTVLGPDSSRFDMQEVSEADLAAARR